MTPAEEAKLASFFARPELGEIRPLLEQIAPGSTAKIDAIVKRVRKTVWKDFT